jgi:serine/threonine-protein kinase HipA
MPLNFIGETLDKHRAHAAARAGELISLYRGIYVDATDDIDKAVMDHAVRIAAYLYPQAYLSGATAARLAPTDDGRLFLSGRRNNRTRIRALEIIQNEAPAHASTIPVIVGDDMGELNLTASSLRQRFLEAFRQRSAHAGAIDTAMRRQMAERLLEEYGSATAAADALWVLGRANRWLRETEAAEQYLRSDIRAPQAAANRAAVDLVVAWHGEIIGRLIHDGAEWRWIPAEGRRPILVRQTRPGSLPPFIESLLPERDAAQWKPLHVEHDHRLR